MFYLTIRYFFLALPLFFFSLSKKFVKTLLTSLFASIHIRMVYRDATAQAPRAQPPQRAHPSAPGGMRAVILVGGFGTRLRPLTLTVPKPLVPFVNKPMIIHQVEALKEAGVTEVILAVAYRPEAMKAEMDEWAKKIGISFVFSVEDEPLGTAGPLGLARNILLKDDKPFFVLNSDVTCSFPLKEFLAFHLSHGKEGSIMTTQVKDWEKYGVVVHNERTGEIQRFVEKPKTFVGDQINAGIYIFNKSVLRRIPPRNCSIEKETFPQMAQAKELYAFHLPGFWMDIGQPKDYLLGLGKFLPAIEGTPKAVNMKTERSHKPSQREPYSVIGCVVIDPSAKIGPGCVIGPNVTIGPNVNIGESCRLENTAIFDNTRIGPGCFISNSIIGWNNSIKGWAHIEENCVFGDDVTVEEGMFCRGTRVLPNKGISKSYFEPEIIM